MLLDNSFEFEELKNRNKWVFASRATFRYVFYNDDSGLAKIRNHNDINLFSKYDLDIVSEFANIWKIHYQKLLKSEYQEGLYIVSAWRNLKNKYSKPVVINEGRIVGWNETSCKLDYLTLVENRFNHCNLINIKRFTIVSKDVYQKLIYGTATGEDLGLPYFKGTLRR